MRPQRCVCDALRASKSTRVKPTYLTGDGCMTGSASPRLRVPADAETPQFSWVALHNGCLCVLPTNQLVFAEQSHTSNWSMEFPKDLRRKTQIYAAKR